MFTQVRIETGTTCFCRRNDLKLWKRIFSEVSGTIRAIGALKRVERKRINSETGSWNTIIMYSSPYLLFTFSLLSFHSLQSADCSNCSRDLRENPFPQFQIISAAKTGSTSLYSYLCEHPSIDCAAKRKELNLLRSYQIDFASEVVRKYRYILVYELKFY
jgi:hypothetical protein